MPSPVPLPVPIPDVIKLEVITKAGNYAFWTAFAVFAIGAIVLFVPHTALHRKSSTFHLVTAVMASIIALSYYAMATGSGVSFATVGIEHHVTTDGKGYDVIISRQIFYVRYIEWTFIGPLYLLNLALLAGLPWADTFTMIVVDVMAAVCCFMGAVTSKSGAMYGWFGLFILFVCYIFYIILVRARRASALQPNHITSLYDLIVALAFVLMVAFVVILILGDGTGHISVDLQAILFTALDFALWLIVPVILIRGYEARAQEIGCGPSAIPDHVFEPRTHGWARGVQLPADN